jgi:hypothetical protein
MRTDAPEPGSLTVPPLHGWMAIVAVLVLAALIGVGYLVARSLTTDESDADDWQSWLEGRSRSGLLAGDMRLDDAAPVPTAEHSRR